MAYTTFESTPLNGPRPLRSALPPDLSKEIPTRSQDPLVRIINTAFVSSQGQQTSHGTQKDLTQLIESPAYQSLLDAVQLLARRQGISELDAAQMMIKTFREIDSIWSSFVVEEGLKSLKGPRA